MDGMRLAPPGSPHLAIVCGNMSPLEEGGVARLQHRDMETILHELGHLLHHVATSVPLASLGGTRVAEDFVEVPSQFLENWGWEPVFLRRLGKHWKTGEAIPEELIEALVRTRNYRAATASMRQLGLGEVDMSLHREFDAHGSASPVAHAREILEAHSPTMLVPEHAMLASFHHLFGSPVGYAAGYYVYKWAEVIEADFFERVREAGIFNGHFGRRVLEQVYAVGNAIDANEIVRNVLGRDADPGALLRRSGLA
jgi:oligopeptidase A